MHYAAAVDGVEAWREQIALRAGAFRRARFSATHDVDVDRKTRAVDVRPKESATARRAFAHDGVTASWHKVEAYALVLQR